MNNSNIILYTTTDGESQIQVILEDETVWLTQKQMAEMFQKDRDTIGVHIRNIYKEGELEKISTTEDISVVRSEGKRNVRRTVTHYNLDVIISVGYRVKSHRGTQFRIWATKQLREYLIKGFVIDDQRLADGSQPNYFEELIERVRDIRTSEANFYQKVKDVFSTLIDYDSKTANARNFYATIQNKFHYAITGMTAAELIVDRIDTEHPTMGLTHWTGEVVKSKDAKVAKNYLQELELKKLQLLVDQFLSYAELQSLEQRPMYMQDWVNHLDNFIQFNQKELLHDAGKVSRRDMEQEVSKQLEEYRTKQVETSNEPTTDT